jgi:tRNA-specific 2-thiouridylase
VSGRIIVGLSGGVDSAVAALLLRERGADVQALFMNNWEGDDDAYCTAAQDFQDARAVARELDIPLHQVDFSVEYRERVFAHFLAEYAAGRTPNPDVPCNREIKFGLCLAYARRLGAEHFATGHYARLVAVAGGVELHQARDPDKDQSYFLHAIDREVLPHIEFPIGDLLKSEVRARARAAGLPVFDKPDSTGICFVGERPFREFLARFVPQSPGVIESEDGEPLGTHPGLAFFTLGQRAGLTIGGRKGRAEAPWYVARKAPDRNALIVVQRTDHDLLLSNRLDAGAPHWLGAPPEVGATVGARVRHRQPIQPARVAAIGAAGFTLEFATPQRAVAPGQYAVLYDSTRCLGGGVIETVHAERSPGRAAVRAASAVSL